MMIWNAPVPSMTKKIQKKIMGDLGMLSKVIHKTILLPDAQV
jgi:hypothetical protein